MCFVFIWEQTATCATYSIKWLVFITEMKSVYSAVRTGYLNIAVCASSVNVFIWEQTATCATYSINWLVFKTEMKSVYRAVRTGYLNKAACASSLKGWTMYKLTNHCRARCAAQTVLFILPASVHVAVTHACKIRPYNMYKISPPLAVLRI
jgi:hypothetical protein